MAKIDLKKASQQTAENNRVVHLNVRRYQLFKAVGAN